MSIDLHEVTVHVNEQPYTVEVESRLLLVHLLRDKLGLTGTHIGCDTSQCGACTVELDGDAVKSCTILAVQCDDARVTTVEGLARDGQLDAVQLAFIENHGLQCGFCTPGMMMAIKKILERYLDPTEQQVRELLDGNICRCTGYQNIVKAVLDAAQKLRATEVTSTSEA